MKNILRAALILIIGFSFLSNHIFAQDTTQTQPTGPDAIFKKRKQEPQDDEKPKLIDKAFIGGNLSLSFASFGGSGNFYVYVSPMFGLHLTPNLNVAAGPLYLYSKSTGYYYNSNNTYEQTQSVFGPRFFVQQRLYRQFFIHGEIEGMNVQYQDNLSATPRKLTKFLTNPLLGVAIVNDSGGKSFYSLTILYNLAYSSQIFSPYGSPLVVRAGLFINWREN